MIKEFTHLSPGAIYFGFGCLDKLFTESRSLGKKAMLVTGKSAMRKMGILDRVISILQKAGVEVEVFDGVKNDPTLDVLQQGIAVGRAVNVDMVIGLGGGSVIDTAKAIAAAVPSEYDIYDLFNCPDRAPVKNNVLSIIAIPTTAGTGSECSMGAILTDRKNKKKGGLRSRYIIPKLTLVDPALTVSMSRNLTAETGFDVFTHAFETYISKARTPITELFSEKALYICGKYLLRAFETCEDQEARGQMSYASMLMGINLTNSSTCLPHRLQYPLSVHRDVSHASGLAMMYPAWLKLVMGCEPERVKRAIKCWNNEAKLSIDEIIDWMQSLELPTSLSKLKISKDECYKMTKEVDGNLRLDPSFKDNDTVHTIYVESL